MRDDLEKLSGVDGHQVLAGDFRVDVGGVGNAQRIMGVDGHYPGFRSDKFFEILQVTNDYIVFLVLAKEECLDHSQAIRHIFGSPIRPRFVDQRTGIYPLVTVLRRNGRG